MLGQLGMATGYLSIFLMPLLLLVGVRLDQPYLAFGVALLVFPLARGIFGAYRHQTAILWHEGVATFLDRLPVVYGIVLATCVLLVIGLIDAGAASTPTAAVGIGLSLWMTMLFATCPAHELIHRRDAGDALVGRFIAGIAGYPLLGYEHLMHHARFGDTERAEWPRLDESLWQFAGRRIRRIATDVVSEGGVLWRRGPRLPGNTRVRDAVVVSLMTWAAFSWAGGFTGFLIYAGVIAGVTLGIQIITYLQHWGLGDDSVADAASRQLAWEDDCLFQAWVTLHISFHQSHHLSARLPYYRLGMTAGSPRQPAGYVLLMLMSLFPRLWRSAMLPALDHWRRQPSKPPSQGRRLTCFALYGEATR
jgi:fatty acid desaturase